MENNICRVQCRVLKALTIMIKIIAYELRVVQANLRSLKVGVDLEFSKVEYFNFILHHLNILPIEDSLL